MENEKWKKAILYLELYSGSDKIPRTLKNFMSNFSVTKPDITARLHKIIELSNALGGPQIKYDPKRGYGLFADKIYEKGCRVTKYGGILIRKKRGDPDPEGDYMGKRGDGAFINGEYGFLLLEKGRWINEKNASRSKVNVKLGTAITTTIRIEKGEQFFADYGDEYIRDY